MGLYIIMRPSRTEQAETNLTCGCWAMQRHLSMTPGEGMLLEQNERPSMGHLLERRCHLLVCQSQRADKYQVNIPG